MVFVAFETAPGPAIWIDVGKIIAVGPVANTSPPFRGTRIMVQGGMFDVRGQPEAILKKVAEACRQAALNLPEPDDT